MGCRWFFLQITTQMGAAAGMSVGTKVTGAAVGVSVGAKVTGLSVGAVGAT